MLYCTVFERNIFIKRLWNKVLLQTIILSYLCVCIEFLKIKDEINDLDPTLN